MKKHSLRSAFVCAVCAFALLLGGCSSASSEPVVELGAFGSASGYDYVNFDLNQGITAEGYWEGVRALDYVTLPEDLFHVSIPASQIDPDEEEIDYCVESLREAYAITLPTMQGEAANGTTVNINYAGSVNGVVFQGGTYEGYDLTIGSGTFIPGFEEQIIGHKPGESFDIKVTFPEGYGDSADEAGNPIPLSGQEAVFRIDLNYILTSELPEVTDKWVDDNFSETDDLHTAAELREYYHDVLREQNLAQVVIDDLIERTTFNGCPDIVKNYQISQCLNYYYTNAVSMNMELDEFLQTYVGYSSADELLTEYEDELTDYCQQALFYQAVAETSGFVVTDEIYEPYAMYAQSYGGENYLRMYLLVNQAITDLCAGAEIV